MFSGSDGTALSSGLVAGLLSLIAGALLLNLCTDGFLPAGIRCLRLDDGDRLPKGRKRWYEMMAVDTEWNAKLVSVKRLGKNCYGSRGYS